MKLKIVIFDRNVEFINRFMRAFQQKYADEISISVFSKEDNFYRTLEEAYTDIVLVEQTVNIDRKKIPNNVIVAYLSRLSDVEEIDNTSVICKYQKVDLIYKQILDIYAENSANMKFRQKSENAKILLFTSVQGGCGTSVAAAAYALRKALDGGKVFYLNLEKFGDTGLYFVGEGKLSFSDVIYSLKSKKSNLAMKIESAVMTDSSGVDFFAPCKNAYDMLELSDSDIRDLLQEIVHIKNYDEIIVDITGELNERMLMLMNEYAGSIIYVSDGSITGNGKFKRFCEAARVIEQRQETEILRKTSLLYNRFSSKTSMQLEKAAVNICGGIHRFEGITGRELVESVSKTEVLGQL